MQKYQNLMSDDAVQDELQRVEVCTPNICQQWIQRILTALFLLLLCEVMPDSLARAADNDLAWEALREGKAIAIMRHALAPGTGDAPAFVLDDCSTQRNLSVEGREQATRIGDRFRVQQITSATVLSSGWCRCLETARLLAFEEPRTLPTLNSFFQDRSTADSQTAELEALISGWLADPGTVRVLVTHQVNISALTNTYAGSGDVLIIGFDGDSLVVLAQFDTL